MAKLPVPKFNLRKRNADSETLISLIYRYRGKRLVYSTGYSIHPIDWNFKTQRPLEQEQRNELFEIRKRLDDLSLYCKDLYIESGFGNIDLKEFKSKLDSKYGRVSNSNKAKKAGSLAKPSRVGFFEFAESELIGMQAANMKKSSYKTFRVHINILREFGVHFDEVNLFTYEDVDWHFRLKLIDWLATRNVQLAYGNKTLKVLKQFLESARRQKLHSNTDYQGKGWTVSRKKAVGQKVLFDEAELLILSNLELSGHLQKIRDICLIGAGTGQRFSDFSKYRPEQFSTLPNGIQILSVISNKTDTPAKIPLNIFSWLLPILERYDYITPQMSMQKFNEGIKQLAKLAGFEKRLLVVNQHMARKTRVEKSYVEKYRLVSSHLCRRSFATILYRKQVPLSMIMGMTGHSTESQLREYIGIDNEQNAKEVGMLFMNLVDKP